MARPKRFELLTPRFVVWCSIQLSYGRGAFAMKGRKSYPAQRPFAIRRAVTANTDEFKRIRGLKVENWLI